MILAVVALAVLLAATVTGSGWLLAAGIALAVILWRLS